MPLLSQGGWMAQSRSRGSRSRRRARGAVTILAVTCLAGGLAACGHSANAAGKISLLPSTATEGKSWAWTAACPYGPHASNGCDPAGPTLGQAQLAGNEWNLGGTQGAAEAVNMSVSPSGGLKLNANLASAPPCTGTSCLTREANTWVRGYPSVLYGIDQCHASTSPAQSPELPLPARVDSLPADLVGSATYDARASQVTYDVAYDLWLSASDTKTPCQTDGTVEVMVWTDYDAKSLLPDSLKVGTTTLPTAVNGAQKSSDQTWSIYVNNVYGNGHTVPWGGTVWLVPDASTATQHGTVTVDLSAGLGAVGTVLQRKYGWTAFASTYWLDTIAFGMEYGPQSADPYGTGPTNFSLDLSKYCLQVGTTVADAGC
jgi:hypothetical protein